MYVQHNIMQVAKLYVKSDNMYILQVEMIQEQRIAQETTSGHNGSKMLVL